MLKFGSVILGLVMVATACSGSTVVTAESLPSRSPVAIETGPIEVVEPEVQQPANGDARPGVETPAADVNVTSEPTLAFLVQAKNNTNATSSFRFEGYVEEFGFGSDTYPLVVGEVAGDRSRTVLDRQEFVSQRFRSFTTSSNDFTLTVVTNADDAYLNAPVLDVLMTAAGVGTPTELAWIDDVATGWGQFDLALVPHGLAIGSLDMGTGASGTALLDVLDTSEAVADGGVGEVRGVPTSILYADVSQLAIRDPSLPPLDESRVQAMEAAVVTIEVHIDAAERIRRIEYETIDIDFGLTAWRRVDYFDFDDAITIKIPTASVEISDGLLYLSSS